MFHIYSNDTVLALSSYNNPPLDFSNKENDSYQQLANELKSDNIILMKQTHSDIIKEVKSLNDDTSNTDAIYTKVPNLYLGVLTADCLPLLLYAPDKDIVAAIHSGWVGSTKLITYKTITHLIVHEGIDPTKLIIYIGPSIKDTNYEVDQVVYDKFIVHEFIDTKSCFTPLSNNKYYLDNLKFNLLLLDELNIKPDNIIIFDKCTFDDDQLFSYRQNKTTSRNISIIGLK